MATCLFVGRGDPDLSNRKFPYDEKIEREGKVEKVLAEMADQAVAKGLKEVDGDIVADDSYFPYDPYPAGWSLGDIFFTFGAPVGAIALNDNAVAIEVTPGARAGDPAIILTHPGAAVETITCEITTGQPGAKSDFAVVRQPGLNFLLLRGTIALGHTTMRLDLAMTQPAETTALALKQLLEERGVRVTGGTRVQHATPPYSDAAGEPIFPPSLGGGGRRGGGACGACFSFAFGEYSRYKQDESEPTRGNTFARCGTRKAWGGIDERRPEG